jgi:hypothetical protein
MRDDIIDMTIIYGRRIENKLPIRKIYEYEENTEELITSSKPKEEDDEGKESKT